MTKKKTAQQYSAEEFDAAVAMIRNDPEVRADIEAITGQKLAGKSPRELFDLFRAIGSATELQMTVARYGRARQLVRETRAALEGTSSAEQALPLARQRIAELEAKVDELKGKNSALNARAGVTPLPTAGRVIRGQVAR